MAITTVVPYYNGTHPLSRVSFCSGVLRCNGTASEPGWTLSALRLAVRSGSTALTNVDARQGTPPKTLTLQNNVYTWTSEHYGVNGKGTGCPTTGITQFKAYARWEKFGEPIREEYHPNSSSISFTATTSALDGSDPLPDDGEGEDLLQKVVRIPGTKGTIFPTNPAFLLYELDVSRDSSNFRLLLPSGQPLRAARIEVATLEVNWSAFGDRYQTFRSTLGNLQFGNEVDRPFETVFTGAICAHQPLNASGRPQILEVVASQNLERPTVVELDPTDDVYLYPNFYPSVLRPHQGRLLVAVRIA
jgi:hypothetical protein